MDTTNLAPEKVSIDDFTTADLDAIKAIISKRTTPATEDSGGAASGRGFTRARIRRSTTGELARFASTFGNRPREPRQRLTDAKGDTITQTPRMVENRRLAVAKKLLHAFRHSYGANAAGEQVRGVLPIDQSDSMSAGNLSSFCQFCEKVWAYGLWSNTVIFLANQEEKREYDGKARALERLTRELVEAMELAATLQPAAVETLAAIEAAQAGIAAAEAALAAVDSEDESEVEAAESALAAAQAVAADIDAAPIAAYRQAYDSEDDRVAAATVARDAADKELNAVGTRCIVTMTAKPGYRDPGNLNNPVRGPLAKVNGIGVAEVTFSRSEVRESMLAAEGESFYQEQQAAALS